MKRIVTSSLLGLVLAATLGTLALDAVAWSDLGPQPLTPLTPLPSIGSLSARQCGACHPDIKREWDDSRHAAAVTDPLYVADFERQDKPYFCNHCHAPLTEQQPKHTAFVALAWPRLIPLQSSNARFDEQLQGEGITCVACHQVDGAMVGPHDVNSPHPTKTTDTLSSETLCERCHTLALTKLGQFQRPLMETVAEWREYRSKGGDKRCVDCHMPRVEDRSAGLGAPKRPTRSHRLRGPADVDFVRTAIEVSEPSAKGSFVQMTVTNLTGHRLPTAEPHRRLEVVLELFDANGVVARSVEVIQRKLDLDALHESPGADSTLHPREQRVITLPIPPPLRPATGARVVVDFWLWDPDDIVAKNAGLSARELVHRIHEAEVVLP